jgi:branched-chain amino acid transport system permease protein
MLLLSLINGLTTGSLYALIALGPSLIYGILRVLDIANAAGLTLGAYVGLKVWKATGSLPLAFAAAIVVSALFGLVLQRFLYRPILNKGPLISLIASIGVFMAMEEVFRLVFGPYFLAFPAKFPLKTIRFGGAFVTGPQVVILLIGLVTLLATSFALKRTRLGLYWRATSQDRPVAEAMGINTGGVIAAIFVIGYALAAVSGVLLGINYNTVYPTMGDIPAYKMLAIIVLGGLGNPLGTIAAAMIIGLIETFVVTYAGFVLPRDAIAFLVLIAILLARPEGLMPASRRAK